jgi:hypothetical protein
MLAISLIKINNKLYQLCRIKLQLLTSINVWKQNLEIINTYYESSDLNALKKYKNKIK